MTHVETLETHYLLSLAFFSGEAPTLGSVEFRCAVTGDLRRTVRGRFSGAYTGAGTFPWTAAVQALCVLLLRSKVHHFKGNSHPLLSGGQGSLAVSLDYSLSKSTLWLTDMFGVTSGGAPVAKKLILRTNSGRRLPGPVVLSLNPRLIRPDQIRVLKDSSIVSDEGEVDQMARLIEHQFMSTKGQLHSLAA